MNYTDFLTSKAITSQPSGIDLSVTDLNPQLFHFQKAICRWALRRGRAALFEDCGLGKTIQQLEFAQQILDQGNVLILAPLMVTHQTKADGARFGYDITICRSQDDVRPGINIANYEMLEHFEPSKFVGVVLDESSILKNFSGKIRNRIIGAFRNTPFKLACTATPAPNDLEELGNHAEFLGIMSMTEMLATFFIHDGGDTSKWRLKGHAEEAFWAWVCSWAVNIRKPSDIGFSDEGFELPPLKIHEHLVETEARMDGCLFSFEARTLAERRDARRSSLGDRVDFAADLISKSDQQSVVWCDLNAESEALAKAIPCAEEIRGSDDPDKKIETFKRFQNGELKTLVTKSSIAGLGLNWQHCNLTYYVGLSDSYERFYQSLRRFYRFGQKQPVHAHVITSTLEGAVLRNIQRKEADAQRLQGEMMQHMQAAMYGEITSTKRQTIGYQPKIILNIPSFL